MPVDFNGLLAGETAEARDTFHQFYNYARSEFNDEQVHFLMLVRTLRGQPASRNLFESHCSTIYARANYIYEHCVLKGSPKQINIPATIYNKMLEKYPKGGFQGETNQDPQLILGFFDEAYDNVYNLVQSDTWNRFMSREHKAACEPAWASASAPAARKRAAPPRKTAMLQAARLLDQGLTSAFAGLMVSPLFNLIPLSQPVAAAAPATAAAPPAQRAFVPYPSAASAPAPMWSASATLSPSSAASAPAPMWSASASASSPTAAPAPAARVAKVAVPVAAPAGNDMHQAELLRFNPPPRGKRILSPLPTTPAEVVRRRAAIAQRLAENPPLPAPPPPTSPVPTVRPVIPKPDPHKH